MNYEEDIRIDETALDVEWVEQPALMMKYARLAADARKYLDQKKEALELLRAEIDKEIRQNPTEFGIEKITENAVQNTIITTEQFREANQKVINAKFDVDIAQAAVIAVSQRKDALENLVRLHGQQYFAGPKIPRNLHDEAEKRRRQRDINQGIKSSITRTK
jgi:hypothetical protein